MKTIQGKLTVAKGARFALVASRFNELITKKLVEGAVDAIVRHGGDESAVDLIWVPGSLELPAAARRVAAKDYAAVVCLGAVIRGQTPHFDYVAAECIKGVAQVALESSAAVTFGVLTTDSVEQAVERAGTKSGNKGFDAACAAIEMADLFGQL